MTTRNKYSSRNKFEKPFIRKACLLCKIDFLDYKNIGLLKKYISDRGKIESAGRTGTCAKCQRNLTVAIKRARHMAFLPLSADHTLNTKVVIYKQEKIQEKTRVWKPKCSTWARCWLHFGPLGGHSGPTWANLGPTGRQLVPLRYQK